MPNMTAWKTDNYSFVGKAFDFRYADRMNKLSPIISEKTTTSVDYMLQGTGGFGELKPYDGVNLNKGSAKRAFATVITPKEYSLTADVGFKECKNDKLGECRRVGAQLGDSATMTVYMHMLRTLGSAFDPAKIGGDGVSWANANHPVASKGSEGRKFIVDEDAGYYSNLMNKVLSVSAITEAQTAANRFVTPDGLPFLCDFDTLLVSPELEPEAKKLCGEDARLDPESANHSANPVRGMHYIVIGGGDAGFTKKQWAVCDRRLMKDIFKIIYNTKPTVLQSNLDNPLIDSYTAYVDFDCGWGDARPIIFSNPG